MRGLVAGMILAPQLLIVFVTAISVGLGACQQAGPPDAAYVEWCKTEFEVARALTSDVNDLVMQHIPPTPIFSAADFESEEAFFEFLNERAANPPAPTALPADIAALYEENEKVRRQLNRIRSSFSDSPLPPNDASNGLFADPKAALDQRDTVISRKREMQNKGEKAASLLPALEKCAERLPSNKSEGCFDPCF